MTKRTNLWCTRSAAVLTLLPLATPLSEPFGTTSVQPSPPAAAPSSAQIRDAARAAQGRPGRVSWAVVDSAGRLRGRHVDRQHRSASLSKAMLLAAYLRGRGDAPVPAADRALIEPMIRISANRKASAVRLIVGDPGLRSVARAAGMTRFSPNGTWSELEVTPADQARFFLRVDRLVPRRHRAYARELLSAITPKQSWGIPAAARPLGFQVLFKGGWRTGVAGQAGLLERDGGRIAIAVLTDGQPMVRDGVRTIRGVAARLAG